MEPRNLAEDSKYLKFSILKDCGSLGLWIYKDVVDRILKDHEMKAMEN